MSVLAQLYLYSREHSSTPSEMKRISYYTNSLPLSANGILFVAVYDLYLVQHGKFVSVDFIMLNALSCE